MRLVVLQFGPEGWWRPVLILLAVVVLAYLAMWWGWRRRGRKHDLPPLVDPVEQGWPGVVVHRAKGRYFGTTVTGDWLDRVVARGLGARSDCTLLLSEHGLQVQRPSGGFGIPTAALVGARRDNGIAGKVVPPRGVLVVTWRHGDHTLDSGFRLDDGDHERWVRSIEQLVKEHTS